MKAYFSLIYKTIVKSLICQYVFKVVFMMFLMESGKRFSDKFYTFGWQVTYPGKFYVRADPTRPSAISCILLFFVATLDTPF